MKRILGIMILTGIVLSGCDLIRKDQCPQRCPNCGYNYQQMPYNQYQQPRVPYEGNLQYDRYERDRDYNKYEDRGYRVVLLQDHNETRKEYRQKELLMNLELEQAAQRHAEWMAQNDTLSHKANGDLKSRVTGNWQYLGENIAYGYGNEKDAFNAWKNSSEHLRNIVSPYYGYVGFGVATSKNGTLYWCAIFGG